MEPLRAIIRVLRPQPRLQPTATTTTLLLLLLLLTSRRRRSSSMLMCRRRRLPLPLLQMIARRHFPISHLAHLFLHRGAGVRAAALAVLWLWRGRGLLSLLGAHVVHGRRREAPSRARAGVAARVSQVYSRVAALLLLLLLLPVGWGGVAHGVGWLSGGWARVLASEVLWWELPR